MRCAAATKCARRSEKETVPVSPERTALPPTVAPIRSVKLAVPLATVRTSGDTTGPEAYRFPAQTLRYLRLVCQGGSAGPAVEVLREQNEALSRLDVALRAGMQSLQEAAGVSPHGFEKWMAEAAPADPKTVEAEKAQFHAESVEAGAKALPLKARMSLVESLLATNTAEIAA